MTKYLLAIFVLLTSVTFAETAPVENLKPYSLQKSNLAEGEKWPMYLQLEGKTGNFRDLARLTLLWPLWQDDNSMFFADIRLMLDNKKDREGNFGLAYRKVCRDITSDGLILGAYAFYDRKRSPFKNWFNQGTFGVEALGNNFQVRGNYYKPQNKSFNVGTSYSLSNPQTGWSNHGNNLVVTYDTVVNTHTHKEQALKGYDADLRFKLPLHSSINFWFGGGYYQYKKDATKVSGPMYASDLEFLNCFNYGSRFSVGYEYKREKEFQKDSHYAVAKLSFPLNGLSPEISTSSIDYQMTRMIERDVDVVSAQSTALTGSERLTGSIIPGSSTLVKFIDLNQDSLAVDSAYLEAMVGAYAQGVNSNEYYTVFANVPSTGQVDVLSSDMTDLSDHFNNVRFGSIAAAGDIFDSSNTETLLADYLNAALENATYRANTGPYTLSHFGDDLPGQLSQIFSDLNTGTGSFALPDLSAVDVSGIGSAFILVQNDPLFDAGSYSSSMYNAITSNDPTSISDAVKTTIKKNFTDFLTANSVTGYTDDSLNDIVTYYTQQSQHQLESAVAARALKSSIDDSYSLPVAGVHLLESNGSGFSSALTGSVEEALTNMLQDHVTSTSGTSDLASASLNYKKPISILSSLTPDSHPNMTLTPPQLKLQNVDNMSFTALINNGAVVPAVQGFSIDNVTVSDFYSLFKRGFTGNQTQPNSIDELKSWGMPKDEGGYALSVKRNITVNVESSDASIPSGADTLVNWKDTDSMLALAQLMIFDVSEGVSFTNPTMLHGVAGGLTYTALQAQANLAPLEQLADAPTLNGPSANSMPFFQLGATTAANLPGSLYGVKVSIDSVYDSNEELEFTVPEVLPGGLTQPSAQEFLVPQYSFFQNYTNSSDDFALIGPYVQVFDSTGVISSQSGNLFKYYYGSSGSSGSIQFYTDNPDVIP